MKVGDYVRIKNEAGWCCVGKICNINEFREPSMKVCVDIQANDLVFIGEDIIVKSSPNIIDLIEAGDYVNGYKVDFVQNGEVIYNHNHPYKLNLMAKDIKSIVTKEQFKEMEYKIGE